jgi:ankyrin repeat protein
MRKNGRALEKAVTARDYQALKMLLDRGIDANSRSGPGESALIMACKLRRIDLVKALLDAGADANTIALFEYHYVRAYYKYTRHKVTENETALGAAVVSGHVEIVHALINAGADVTTPTAGTTSRDLLHGTPLDLAICCGHVSIVEVLLSAGADINTDKLRTWDNLNHNFRPDPMPLYRNQILAELEDARAKDILAGRANEN